MADAAETQRRKVALIFRTFDKDSAGGLDKAKVASFIRTVNPGVPLTPLQVEAIVDEVFEEYAEHLGSGGLSLAGLERIYSDGIGSVDIDFATLGLKLELPPEQEVLSTKSSLTEALSITPRQTSETAPASPAGAALPPPLELPSIPRLSHQPSGAESLPDPEPEPASQQAQEAVDSMEELEAAEAALAALVVPQPPQHQPPQQQQQPPPPRQARPPPLRLEAEEEPLQARASVRGSLVAGIRQRLEAKASPRDAPSPGSRGPPSVQRLPSPARAPSPALRRPPSPAGRRVAALVSSLEAASPVGPGRGPSPQRSARTPARRSFGAMDWVPPQLAGARERPPPSQPQRAAELPARGRTRPAESVPAVVPASVLAPALAPAPPAEEPVARTDFFAATPHEAAAAPDAAAGAPTEAAAADADPASSDKGGYLGMGGGKRDALLMHRTTDSRDSTAGGGIRARGHGSQAGSDADAPSDEAWEDANGGLLRLPSAVSIEARSAAGSFGEWMTQHSRVPSAAEEILEAANMAPLHVVVPPAVNRAASNRLLALSPSSSARAEMEAEVGHESLGSPGGAGAELADAVVEVDADLLAAEVAAAATGELSRQQASELRTRIQLASDPQAGFGLHTALGRLLADRDRHEEAVLSFQAAAGDARADARAHFRLGNALFALERYSEAELAFKQALKTAADAGGQRRLVLKIYTNLGISLEAQGLLLGACERYREAAALEPRAPRAWKLLGGALYGLGDLAGAEKALQTALHLDARNADAHCDLGCTLCARGNVAAARQQFDAALQVDPSHVEAWFNLGNLERQGARYEAALACYGRVLACQPGHWRALLNACIALVGLRRPAEAQAALRQALEISGQAEAVREEAAQLARLAERGASAAELAGVASAVSQKTASAAPSPLRPTPERPHRERRGGGGGGGGGGVDLPVLRALAPLTRVVTRSLLLTARQLAQTEAMSALDAEALLRELLPELPARAFAGLTKAAAGSLLPALAPPGRPGTVQPPRLLAALACLADESWYSRGRAAFALLAAGQGFVLESEADALLAALQAAFASARRPREASADGRAAGRFAALHTPEELMAALTEAGRGLEALPRLPSLALGRDA